MTTVNRYIDKYCIRHIYDDGTLNILDVYVKHTDIGNVKFTISLVMVF